MRTGPGRLTRALILAGYVLAWIGAGLTHNHGPDGCCDDPACHKEAAAEKHSHAGGCCHHAHKCRHGKTTAPSVAESSGPASRSTVQTVCMACQVLGQPVSPVEPCVLPAASGFVARREEAAVRTLPHRIAAPFAARGPPVVRPIV
jgi:hypothetical protein